MCPSENAHTTNSNAKLFRRSSMDGDASDGRPVGSAVEEQNFDRRTGDLVVYKNQSRMRKIKRKGNEFDRFSNKE